MAKKIFDLSDAEIDVLHEIMDQSPEVKTEVGAIRFLIEKYKLDVIDVAIENQKQQEELLVLAKQIKKTLNYAERNTEILVDAVNTVLMLMNKDAAFLKDIYPHPLITLSEQNIKEKIETNQQKLIHRNSRKGRK